MFGFLERSSHMINVIGLGNAGVAISEKFKQWPPYKVHQIDIDSQYPILSLDNHEQYENLNPPNLEINNEEVLFITSCGNVSGLSLRLLQQLKDKQNKIRVVYIKPDEKYLAPNKRLFNKIIYNVLQEYTRSGIFDEMYIFDNNNLKNTLAASPIAQHFNLINYQISYILHMNYISENLKSVYSNVFIEKENIHRISTFSVLSLDKAQEQCYLSHMKTTRRKYVFNLPKKELDNGNLLNDIEKMIKKLSENEYVINMFSIFETAPNYDIAYNFCKLSSNSIQSL